MLAHRSTAHHGIINDKADYISGKGITCDERDIRLREVIHKANGQRKTLWSVMKKAQDEYLRPVFGGLYDAWLDGKYGHFVDRYIKRPPAFFVRCGVISDISIQMDNNGFSVPFTGCSNASADKQREMVRSQAMKDAGALLKEAFAAGGMQYGHYLAYKPQ